MIKILKNKIRVIVTLILVYFTLQSYAQKSLLFGVGLRNDRQSSVVTHLPDSVVMKTGVATDPLMYLHLGLSYKINPWFYYNIHLYTYHRYTGFQVGREAYNNYINGSAFSAIGIRPVYLVTNTAYLPAEFGVEFKRLKFDVGIGPSININARKIDNFKSIDYPETDNAYLEIQKIARPLTFNYSYSLSFRLIKEVYVQVAGAGGIGSIMKDLQLNNQIYHQPVHWLNYQVALSYCMPLQSK